MIPLVLFVLVAGGVGYALHLEFRRLHRLQLARARRARFIRLGASLVAVGPAFTQFGQAAAKAAASMDKAAAQIRAAMAVSPGGVDNLAEKLRRIAQESGEAIHRGEHRP